jgi:MtrB/PioB family decaheme-associated outer membrane protein
MSRKLLALLIANLFVAAPAFAQSDDFRLTGSVSVGGLNVDDDDAANAAKLNEYRDLSSGGLLGFDLMGRGGRYWLNGIGENLGRDDMYLSFRGGSYDAFKYRLYYDSLKHNFLYGGRTPYANAGSNDQTATFPNADTATWNSLDVGYKRRDAGGYFEFQSLSPWYFRADANQVTNTGSKYGASSQGTSPGNGNVDLAFPVEYTTKNTMLEAGYNSKTVHAALSWMTSKFDNDNDTVKWNNGYFANGKDTSYLPPDNKYQRIAGNLTFRGLPMTSTAAFRFTKDELESNAMLGTTVLGTGAALLPTGPNVSDYNGKVENETFSATLSSAPTRGLDTRVYYNYYKRDDNSTQVTYLNSAVSTEAFHNEHFSYEKNNFGIDAYYRFNRGNRIGGGYDWLKTERTRFDFDESEDQRFFFEYKNTMLDNLAARLKYTMLKRDSNFLLANDGTGPQDVAYWNRFLKAYDVTDLDRDELKLTLDWTAADNLDVSFEAISKKNKYRDQVLGRLNDDRVEFYGSVSYAAAGMRFTLFGDVENVEYESRHRVVGNNALAGAYDPSAPPNASNYNWEGKNKDKNWATGLAVDAPISAKFALKASLIYYKTDGSVDFAAQLAPSPTYPAPISQYDDSKRTQVNIKGVYTIDKQWTVTAGYAYEKYDYSDAQYDGYRLVLTNSNAAQNSYYNGYNANPQYKANILYGWVTYRF